MQTPKFCNRNRPWLTFAILIGCCLTATKVPAAPISIPSAPAQHAAARLAQFPLFFERNQGQSDKAVQFLARGAGYDLFLTAGGAVVTLRPAIVIQRQPQGTTLHWPHGVRATPLLEHKVAATLRLQLLAANPAPPMQGEAPLPGVSNYLLGPTARQWQTRIQHYSSVRYHNVYPGIDLLYHGHQQRLEYDFVVAPGADARQIRWHWQGAQQLRLNEQGALEVKVGGATLTQPAPLVYQQQGTRRQLVAGRYQLRPGKAGGNPVVAFALGSYDHNRPLVIDPILVYSTYIGGSAGATVEGIAADAAGNVYITGETTSVEGPFAHNPTTSSQYTGFVAKLNPAGNQLLYVTFVAGAVSNSNFGGPAIAIDAQSNVYLTGGTNTAKAATPGAFDQKQRDSFVAKIDATGSKLLYYTYLDGDDPALAVSAAGNAYVCGSTTDTAFPTRHPLQPSHIRLDAGYYPIPDAFVTEFNASGSDLIYSTFLGGTADDEARAIALDTAGNAYVTGETSSTDFPTFHPFQATAANLTAVFVSKINAAGTALVYSTYLGGQNKGPSAIGSDDAFGIAVDAAGSAYVTGMTTDSTFPLKNSVPSPASASPGSFQVFVTKFDPAGMDLVYSTFLPSNSNSQGNAIAVNAQGEAYVTGVTNATNFPVKAAFQTTNRALDSGPSVFIAKLNAAGNSLIYSSYFGGPDGDSVADLALDAAGNAYIGGNSQDPDVPITPGGLPPTTSSPAGFVAKISAAAEVLLVQFTSLRDGAVLTSFPSLQGIAVVQPAGTFATQVVVFLQRRSDKQYWTGSGWSAQPTPLPTTLNGRQWTLKTALPSGANLQDDNYLLSALASDTAGHQGSATITVTIDRTAPTVSITTPANGSTVSSLSVLAGTATDTNGTRGSGVASVQLQLRRVSDGRYYSGSGWVTSATSLTTTVSGSLWVRRSGLPSGAALEAGSYRLIATAFDRAGNHSSVTSSFVVVSTGLSAALVQVRPQRVALNFVGALDAASAEDASHYSVTVNGVSVSVAAASYNASSHTVDLELAPGVLQAGDQIVVGWTGLRAADGSILSGQTDVLKAG